MRIVALSDQHGYLPEIPPCDLVIVAGDICPDGVDTVPAILAPERQKDWFDRTIRPWLAASPAMHKIVTWGNHDWCGEACGFERDSPARAPSRNLQIVVDELTSIPRDDGPPLSVWATPWSNRIATWAFMKNPEELAAVYARIPAGIDILVSHQAPSGSVGRIDRGGWIEDAGSRELLATIERVRPRLVICGHIHEGHGRAEHHGIPIYNVTVVDERYRLVHAPTVIDLD